MLAEICAFILTSRNGIGSTDIVSCLRSGKVVGVPTDTFYGLAVDPVNLRAVERIYEIKTRLKHKPLSLLIASAAQAYELARQIDSRFDLLAERFWPALLTLIVRAGSRLPLRSTANTGNVALRVPDAAIPRAIVEGLGLPITATSANLAGLPECNYAACVRDQIGDRVPLIVDGGPPAAPWRLPSLIFPTATRPGKFCGKEPFLPTRLP